MSWRSVLLVEETGVPGENQRSLYRDIFNLLYINMFNNRLHEFSYYYMT